MRSIRRLVASLCLTTTLAASGPVMAGAGEASSGSASVTSSTVKENPKLDLSQLRTMSVWNAPARPFHSSPMPLKANRQTSGGASRMSAAKKTWIIVGIVVGAALVVTAVSHNDGGNGGGGY